jgi:hypothetical protein
VGVLLVRGDGWKAMGHAQGIALDASVQGTPLAKEIETSGDEPLLGLLLLAFLLVSPAAESSSAAVETSKRTCLDTALSPLRPSRGAASSLSNPFLLSLPERWRE